MSARDITGSHRVVIPHKPNGKAEEARIEERILRQLVSRILSAIWAAVPAKKALGWLGAIVTVLGAGGIGIKEYVPIRISSPWVTKEDFERAKQELNDKIDATAKGMPAAVWDEFDKREAERATKAVQPRRGRR